MRCWRSLVVEATFALKDPCHNYSDHLVDVFVHEEDGLHIHPLLLAEEGGSVETRMDHFQVFAYLNRRESDPR